MHLREAVGVLGWLDIPISTTPLLTSGGNVIVVVALCVLPGAGDRGRLFVGYREQI